MIPKEALLANIQKRACHDIKGDACISGRQNDFFPSRTFSNASQFMATFVFEMYLIESCVLGEKIDRSNFKHTHQTNCRHSSQISKMKVRVSSQAYKKLSKER